MQQELGIGSRVQHPTLGKGVVINVKFATYSIVFTDHGKQEISRTQNQLEVIECIEAPDDLISNADIERSLTQILRRWSDIQEEVSLGNKWVGGKLILQPADRHMQGKEMPIDTFFHKIVMLRDRIRVMEQRINAHDKLSDEDKVNLQQYITRIYGSLTSFNVLFKFSHDHFIGEKGKDNND